MPDATPQPTEEEEESDFWELAKLYAETGGPDIGDFKFGVPGVRVDE